MKLLRKVIFWCHLVTGLFAGIVILVMSVTGVLLAYERQITHWADTRGYYAEPPSQSATRLPVETLLERVRQARPNATPSGITVRADRSAPAEVSFGREGSLFLNSYTGEVLGEGSKRARAFFRGVTDWHRWLGASGEGKGRTIGRAFTGAFNLAFLFMVVSGFYLWWPRNWTWRLVRSVTWFKRGLKGKARDFSWHNVIGLWSAVPLFIIVLSGVVISYTWAGNLVYRLVGEAPPVARPTTNPLPASADSQQRGGTERPDDGSTAQVPKVEWDRLWKIAEEQQTGWKIITLRFPATADTTANFTIDLGNGGQPHKRSQLTLDIKTGETVRWEPFSSNTTGRRLRSFLRFAHTGEVGGIVGQTIAALVSAGAAVLVWTGLALAWRRFRSWRAKRTVGESLPAN